MKQILKIGVSIIGIILLMHSLNDTERFIRLLMNLKESSSIMGRDYSGYYQGFSVVTLILKFIAGLVFVLKPSIITNIYIPQKVEDNDNTTYKLVISFIFCFGVYLMVTGGISSIRVLISQFVLSFSNTGGSLTSFRWVDLVFYIIKIVIGYTLYKNFFKEIYRRDINSEIK